MCFFCFDLKRCPFAHPRMTLAHEVPSDHRLLSVGVCLCVVNAYMSRQEGMWACVRACTKGNPFLGTLVMKSNLPDWIHDGRRNE